MARREPHAPARTKAALRARFAAYRRHLGRAEYEQLSRSITARVQALPELRAAHVVHVYWPLVERHEVDTRPLIFSLYAHRKEILLPVVTFDEQAGDASRLVHRRFTGQETLRANRWGIHEPTGAESIPLDRVEAVVVPALGAGRNGHRIGHGHGFYDEMLQSLTVPKICPVYDACLVEAVPAEAHDVPMSVIVTEKEVLRCNSM